MIGAGVAVTRAVKRTQKPNLVCAYLQDSFVVRSFSPVANPMVLVNELPLKLARKCLDAFGTAPFDQEVEIHSLSKFVFVMLMSCHLNGQISTLTHFVPPCLTRKWTLYIEFCSTISYTIKSIITCTKLVLVKIITYWSLLSSYRL